MTRPSDERILAFLSGDLDEAGTREVLEAMEESPELTARVRAAAAGLAEVEAWVAGSRGAAHADPAVVDANGGGGNGGSGNGWARDPAPSSGSRPTVPAWWVPLAVAASVALAVPATLWVTPDAAPSASPDVPGVLDVAGAPVSPEPSFVLVLHGRWPDAAEVDPAETQRRAEEYWRWTSGLAERGLLLAAGDLRWEPGLQVTTAGSAVEAPAESVADPGFLVGMFALRAASYDAALAIAEECPHLAYGGSVSVRRVGSGFVTMPGMADWSD